jgi:hypothetical protein
MKYLRHYRNLPSEHFAVDNLLESRTFIISIMY